MALQYDQNQANIDNSLTPIQLQDQTAQRSAVSLDQMSPVVPITLTTPTAPTVQPDALVAGATTSVAGNEDYLKQQATLDATKSQKDTALQDYINSQMGLANRPADLLEAQKQAGADEAIKKRNQYKNLVETGNASYAQLIAKENADMAKAEATSRSAFDYAGSSGAIQRQALAEKALKAAEITMNSALYNAANGDLTTALQLAKDSVDAKYSVLENVSNIKKTQLEDIYDTLNKEEKKTADALLRKQKLEDDKIAEEKAKEKAVQSVMLEAAKFGADQQTLNKIQSSGSVGEAIANSGSFLSAEFKQKVEQQKFENNVQLQQLAISRANYALSARKQELEELKAAGLGDVSQLSSLAAQYASTGTMPTQADKAQYGAIANIAKELPKDTGTLVDKNTGTHPSAMKSGTIDGVSSLYDLVKKLDQAKSLFSTLQSRGETGVLGGTVGGISPSIERQAYDALKSEFTDLLARARTGAAITAYEEKQYAAKLPGYFNKTALLGASGENKIENLKKSLEGKLNTTLNLNGASIYGYSKVKLDGKDYTVGDIISNGTQQARVNPDGTLTIIQ